jgi:predicted amidophosphoribosyltransferase
MSNIHPRIKRERKTIKAMIGIYCKGKHKNNIDKCPICKELLDYSLNRLDKCKFQENKPICARCPIHCYKPDMREKIRSIMRYAGPRILYHHPILAILHLIDRTKKV